MPRAVLPEPPAPLRYDGRDHKGEETVFVSALLYRQERFRFPLLPLPRVSHPQFHIQLCAIDGDGAPVVFVPWLLLPRWVTPGARWVTGRPAHYADMVYPPAVSAALESGTKWEVQRRDRLLVSAEAASPMVGEGPVLGPWDRVVSYLCRRTAAYSGGPRGLRRLEVGETPGEVTPVKAELLEDELLYRLFPHAEPESWPPLHSAWLSPPITTCSVSERVESPLGGRVPAPG